MACRCSVDDFISICIGHWWLCAAGEWLLGVYSTRSNVIQSHRMHISPCRVMSSANVAHLYHVRLGCGTILRVEGRTIALRLYACDMAAAVRASLSVCR